MCNTLYLLYRLLSRACRHSARFLLSCLCPLLYTYSQWMVVFFTVLFFDFYFDFWLVGFDVLFWYLVNWNGSNPILKLSLILVEIMGALPIFLQPSSCFIDA